MGFTSRKFWMSNIIASSIWAITFVSIGILFAEYYESILKYIGWVFTMILILVFAYLWKFKNAELREYWQEKNKEMQQKYSQK